MSGASEGVFHSALQPNNSTVSTYAVPSENLLSHGGTMSNEALRSMRVKQQVAARLAEKPIQPRRTTTTSNYASSDYGGSSTMKYNTYNPNFSSKSYMFSNNRPVMAHRMSQQSSSGYSSRSAMDFGTRAQISQGASAGMMYHQDDMGGVRGMSTMGGGYQSGQNRYQMTMSQMSRPISRGAPDPETFSLHSQQIHPMQQQAWLTRNGSEGSLGSDQDNMYSRQESAYTISNGYPFGYPQDGMYNSLKNEFQSGASHMSLTLPSMRPSSGLAMARNGSGMNMGEETFVRQSYKGPSQRTISKLNQGRQNRYSLSGESIHGGAGGGSFGMSGAGSQTNLTMIKGRMSRAPSMRSVVSVGHGMDLTDSGFNVSGLSNMTLEEAVLKLKSDLLADQVKGAAFIQHECYHKKEAKDQVNALKGIKPLVDLFNSDHEDVARFSTGAARNLIYENLPNKIALMEANGIAELLNAMTLTDDELQKNITGILWNLSSRETLKDKLVKDALPRLTQEILIPLSGTGNKEFFEHNDSETEIFLNTTGCIRNLSSLNASTREKMRETPGLVVALVGYVTKCMEDSRVNDKGVENIVCVLRNLSYQLYSEVPQAVRNRLEGSRAYSTNSAGPITCFTPGSKKETQKMTLNTFSEVSKQPNEMEWLWHPKVVELYHKILTKCDTNSSTREAAAGALQNITAGDTRWASVLSRVAIEKEVMLPTIMDCISKSSDAEMRTLAGFLRNLSRLAVDKDSLAPNVVSGLVRVLPDDGKQKSPSPETVLNICGALNNLVTCSAKAAREICDCDGLNKLVSIKNVHNDGENYRKQARAAATVLFNMYQHKKLHKLYNKKGLHKGDMLD